jgi:hypothetical protein
MARYFGVPLRNGLPIGLGSSISMGRAAGSAVAAAVDPYFYSVTSLLHGDGTNGAQNNTFLDSSTNNFTITRNGNTTQGSFSPFSQTGWGNYFDGTGDYLTIADNTALDMGNSNFTIEGWYYPLGNASVSTAIFSKRADSSAVGGVLLYYGGTGLTPSLLVDIGGSWAINSASTVPFAADQWNHFAVVRNGSAFNLYINGVSGVSATNAGSIPDNSAAFTIGATGANGAFPISACYMSNFRVVKGTAVYTANFTPPTAPLTAITNTSLLTCQANRFLDASSNAFAITRNGDVSVQPFSPFNPTTAYSTSAVGGSGYFDGSGDYLSIADNAALQMGSTSEWTVELWFYSTSGAGSNQALLRNSSGTYAGIAIVQNGTNLFVDLSTTGSAWSWSTGARAINLNAWNHLAVVRNGATTTAYLNGTSYYSASSVTVWNSSAALTIGSGGAAFEPYAGYISNVRIVKGTAVYTANFTPPTAPLTAIANTSLLTNFTNAGIFDNAADADYETVGNAQISTSVKKYGTGSMYFDGTGDYLISPANTQFGFGTGDFTVEAWIYVTTFSTTTGFQAIFSNRNSNSAQASFDLGIRNSDRSLYFYNRNTDASTFSSGKLSGVNTWSHVAISRIGNTVTFFIDGNNSGTVSVSTNSFGTSNVAYVGSNFNATPDAFNGYIDDLRISKGVARYAYNFTPPAAALPDIGGPFPTLTADPYYEYATLLLPGNGTNGAQNNTFLDSSTNAFSITRNGNTTQGTFSPFSQTGWGNYFDGTSGQYLNAPANAAFNFGTGDFTVEAWVYPTSTSGTRPIVEIRTSAPNSTGFALLSQSGATTLNVYTNGGFAGASTGSIATNQWNHVALTRSGNTWTYWINGTSSGSFTNSSTQSDGATTGPKIAGSTTAGEVWVGYLSNVRVVKGTAVYTTNFTPSTTPLTAISGTSLLTCQSNRFSDNSSNAFAITVNGSPSVQAFSPFNPTAAWSAATNGGSGYFDGSGDNLITPTNTALDFGSGNFTIDFWVYPTAFAAYQIVVGTRPDANNYTTAYSIGYTNAGTLFMYTNSFVAFSAAGALRLSEWNYVAVTRTGTTIQFYVNGVSSGTAGTNSQSFSGYPVRINGNGDGSEQFTGYVSSVRVIKGTAITPTLPTAPLAAITNTSLLLNFTNAGIYDATSKNNLETVGNAQISTTQSKFGGSSMAFDGSGDSLSLIQAAPNLIFGTGDFTIECWVYLNSPISEAYLINQDWNNGGSGYSNYLIYITPTTGVTAYYSSTNGSSWNNITNLTMGTLTAGTWNHLAVTRYNGTTRTFLNGVLRGSSADTGDYSNTGKMLVGKSGGSSATFNGYLQDLRFTKGIARYTSNFTPPTTAFPVL